jgi:hypothetical protein
MQNIQEAFMMKSILSAIVILILSASIAGARVLVETNDGNTFTWNNYHEQGASYCTSLSGGMFCVSKSDIKSVKEVHEELPANPDATGSYNSSGSSNSGSSIIPQYDYANDPTAIRRAGDAWFKKEQEKNSKLNAEHSDPKNNSEYRYNESIKAYKKSDEYKNVQKQYQEAAKAQANKQYEACLADQRRALSDYNECLERNRQRAGLPVPKEACVNTVNSYKCNKPAQ